MIRSLSLLAVCVLNFTSQVVLADAFCAPEDRLKAPHEIVAKFRSGGEFGRVTLFEENFKDQNIETLKTGNVNFLHGSWDRLNIKHSEFTRAYFTDYRFSDVKLSHVDLRGAHFRQSVLKDVRFTDVDARAMQMDSVSLENVHWDGVKLKGASIIFSKFKNCKFENIDWNKVVLVGTTFENCTGAPVKQHSGTYQASK
ncbi:pentapeptide repeat-containing protein [Bdellovibrio sp. KM01]|uniref:pentapeptide repeat-containing protein n=1 Tax=Bdellovibrio sp. KM01 TaxID=2748865 RepID=UPI0015EA5CC1|nr:pentapeptide repeat-containing protein [Bdellovibrio sp. KM01]QLY24316.1 pentapeptide repeat-containing protein [Bdellovibrio sp. KM01]